MRGEWRPGPPGWVSTKQPDSGRPRRISCYVRSRVRAFRPAGRARARRRSWSALVHPACGDGAEHLTTKQITRLNAKLEAGDPHHKVTLAWGCHQKLRAVYHSRPEQGRRLVAKILAAFPCCPIPEVARLGRSFRRWLSAILPYFDTAGASNSPTEAVNGMIETMRRVARGFRDFDNYRLRALLAAGGHRPWRNGSTHAPL